MNTWTLHEHPHRHYKVSADGAKPTWNGDDKQRIVSVTTVLGGPDNLTGWAASQAVTACSTAARRYLGAEEHLNGSILPWATLVELTGEMPDQVRDAAAVRGTAAHTYLSDALHGLDNTSGDAEYGHRQAIDAFLDDAVTTPCCDRHGARIERAVGCSLEAVAGTYDAHVFRADAHGIPRLHRLDLKTSNTIRASHFAQLAAYEYLARICGEDPSAFLSILHIDLLGNYRLHSIEVGGDEHQQALDLWNAALTTYRNTSALNKYLKEDNA